MPKQQGSRTDLQPLPAAMKKSTEEPLVEIDDEPPPVKPKPKLEVAAELGFNKNQVAQFHKLADNPAAVKKTIDEAGKHEEIATRSKALENIKRAEKTQRQKETAERKAYTPPTEIPTDKFKLIRADIRDGLAEIADNSVDFIITDPPYPKEFLPLYADVSKVAARVLKDGGSLICMTGQSYLPDVIQLLSTEMRYHWCLSYLTPGGQSAQLFNAASILFGSPCCGSSKAIMSAAGRATCSKVPSTTTTNGFTSGVNRLPA